MNNKTRYAVIMMISVLMNFTFSKLATMFQLPVWLDVTGTAFAAILLEPTAGLLVGLINNFYSAIFLYGNSSLIYYSISAAVALIAGLCVRRNGKITFLNIITSMGLVILVSTLLSGLLTIWTTGGESVSYWELYYDRLALSLGVHRYIGTFAGVFVVKVYDTIATALVVLVCCIICPKKLRTAPLSKASQSLKI